MTLVPCSECDALVSDRAVACTDCGHPLHSRETWRSAFSQAWKPAVAFPLVFALLHGTTSIVGTFQGAGAAGSQGIQVPNLYTSEVGFMLAAYGFVVGLAAVAASELAAALLRTMGMDVARWRLAEPAVYIVIAGFGLVVAAFLWYLT